MAQSSQFPDPSAPTPASTAALLAAGTHVSTPDVNDKFAGVDHATGGLIYSLWSDFKATLKTYFDAIYAAVSHSHAESDITGLVAALAAKVDGTAGVKVYRALLTQSGTSAPVATVRENTLGAAIVWSYLGVGAYLGTLTGAFPLTKTLILTGAVWDSGGSVPAYLQYLGSNVDGIQIIVTDKDGSNLDGVLARTALEILVYP